MTGRGEQLDPPGSFLRNRSFTIFWVVQGLSVLGDAFSFVAVPLLVLRATGSVTQMGPVTALTSVGGAALLTAAVAGSSVRTVP